MTRLIVMAALAIVVFSALPKLVSSYMQTNGYAEPAPKAMTHSQDASPAKKSSGSAGRIKLTANSQGHFLTRARLNGKSIKVLVDTGASSVVLSYKDARKIGLNPRESDFNIRVQTANGIGKAARIKLRNVELGAIRESNIPAMIAPKGALNVTLLGMTFLKELKRFELSGSRLILEN